MVYIKWPPAPVSLFATDLVHTADVSVCVCVFLHMHASLCSCVSVCEGCDVVEQRAPSEPVHPCSCFPEAAPVDAAHKRDTYLLLCICVHRFRTSQDTDILNIIERTQKWITTMCMKINVDSVYTVYTYTEEPPDCFFHHYFILIETKTFSSSKKKQKKPLTSRVVSRRQPPLSLN